MILSDVHFANNTNSPVKKTKYQDSIYSRIQLFCFYAKCYLAVIALVLSDPIVI